ncbi:hypothetical protein JS518_15430 [Clostridiales bacterium FE2010]|nr:hypothetical protein JS518_15430 [Clostridiales bacterium FE2010]
MKRIVCFLLVALLLVAVAAPVLAREPSCPIASCSGMHKSTTEGKWHYVDYKNIRHTGPMGQPQIWCQYEKTTVIKCTKTTHKIKEVDKSKSYWRDYSWVEGYT